MGSGLILSFSVQIVSSTITTRTLESNNDMAELEGTFDQAINAPSTPTVSEDRSARNATRQSSQSSTGACDACRLRKVKSQ